MGQPKSSQAFTRYRAAMDEALQRPQGLIIQCTPQRAGQIRFALYTARTRERQDLAKAYGPDTPCPWDALEFLLTSDGVWLRPTDKLNLTVIDPVSKKEVEL